jgi:KDO2-lipid IV(A) lauroyltransferase
MSAVWRGLALVVGLLPWGALRTVGAAFGWLAGSVLGIRRRHVEASMRASGIERPEREARAMYRSLGTSAAELLWVAARGKGAPWPARIDGASRVRLDDALARGRGAVFAASHTANWDLAACAIARERPLLVVTKHLRAAAIDRFWQSTRANQGVLLSPARGALARARAVLAGGGAVAMMIDQVPESCRHAVRGDVLGRPAWIDRAPAALAARTGAPLVVTAGRRDAQGAHRLHVLAVFTPPPRAGRAWIDSTTRAASAALDVFVRENPSQWLWLHRRWRDPRPRRPPPPSTPRRAGLHSLLPWKTRSSLPDTHSPAA